MKHKLLKSLLLLCALVVGMSTAWADTTITIDFENNAIPTGWTNTNDMAVVSNPVSNTSSTNGSYCLSTNGKASNSLTSGYIENIVSISIDATRTSNNTTNEVYIDFCPNTSFGSTDTQSQSVTVDKSAWKTSTLTLSSKASGYVRIRRSGGTSTATKFIDNIVITCGTSGGSSTPSISAENVNIAYNATGGSIAYTLDSATGNVSASVTTGSDWLTLGTITSSAVPFTCSANPGTTDRTATVTLSHSATSDKVVTITQAGNPDALNNISDITASGTAYKVKGTVVATNARGFVIGDGTGYVYYYKGEAPTQAVNDKVKIAGTTGTYGQIIQFTSSATITTETSSAYNGTPAATVITSVPDYSTGLHLSTYLQFEGTLTKSSDNYLISVGGKNIQISYPTTAQGDALTALNGKTVRVKGYFSGINSSSNFTVMLESVEEVVTPTIVATPTTLTGFTYVENAGPSTAKTISVSGAHLTADISLTASTNYEISKTENSGYDNSLTLTQASGAVAATTIYVRQKANLAKGDYDGTITLSSTGATDATVSLSGSVEGPSVSWDLSTNSYASSSEDLVTWSSTYATMTNAKGKSTTAANSYLGGSSTNTQTRFYKDQIIKFTPVTGYEIIKVEITSTNSDYAGYFNTTWTNASASVNGSVVTVTPADGNEAFYMTVSTATRATAVKVYYQTSTIPYITASDVNIACDATAGSIAYTINNPSNGGVLTAALTTGNWLELGDVSTTVPFTTTANNTKLDRSATVTLTYTYDTNKTTTKVVTITQAGDPNAKNSPVINVPDNVVIAYGSTYTVDNTAITGGAITVTSNNTAIATVNGLVITPVAVGITTITVATAENDTYAAGSETFELLITPPVGKKLFALFGESFDNSTGGPLSTWGGSEANGTLNTDNTGWTNVSGSGAGGCAKFGTSNAAGSATTPSIAVENGETYSLSFKAAPWGTEASKTMTVTVTGGTISGNASATTSSMTIQQWNDYSFNIVATSTSITVKFECSATRFFLDEVKLVKVGTPTTATVTLNKYGYATYCSLNPIDFSSTTGYTAWRVSEVASNGTITFQKITEKIKGGQGVLLYNKNADGVNTTNVTINFADGTKKFTAEENRLDGTTAPFYVDGDYLYGLKVNAFVPISENTVIPANKAVLPAYWRMLSGGGAMGGVKEFTLIFEDEATGIRTIETISAEEAAQIFDLSGRRLNKMQKGINIVNGKKILK